MGTVQMSSVHFSSKWLSTRSARAYSKYVPRPVTQKFSRCSTDDLINNGPLFPFQGRLSTLEHMCDRKGGTKCEPGHRCNSCIFSALPVLLLPMHLVGKRISAGLARFCLLVAAAIYILINPQLPIKAALPSIDQLRAVTVY